MTERDSQYGHSASRTAMRVLIADDSRTSLAVLDKHIRAMGHGVMVARDGDEALRLYRDERPDLVLMDVIMPGQSGLEVARAMRQALPHEWIPIIFLSGRVEDRDVAEGIEAGGDDYLTKPVNPLVLRAKILAMQRIAAMRRELAEANRRLARLSTEDPLTGLANRRGFDGFLQRQWKSAARHGDRPLCLLMIDVDDFKAYNDRYGHQRGDECLQRIGRVIQDELKRGSDLAARYGGEEFVVVIPETPLRGGLAVAARIMRSLRREEMPHAGTRVRGDRVTVSIGAAAACPGPKVSPSDLLQAADLALYEAKEAGRDAIRSRRLDDTGGFAGDHR
ncbi:MAG TPA: diguanylate cyclase [Gammaproteobacteria bacterium]|nr:diguanylate cyclase [Gammaproteobacteria bacterium]